MQPSLFDTATLPISASVRAAVERIALSDSVGERGAVFTRVEVVEFILDAIGYTADRELHRQRILEPSFGNGDFLLPIVDRLLAAWRRSGGRFETAEDDLSDAVRAVELHHNTYAATRAAVVERLTAAGIGDGSATALTARWLVQGDFLLAPDLGKFDFVAGNPPYVRQELVPPLLLAEYRQRFGTLYDRADLYIPFIERSLALLQAKGTLGFICADRWTKNRYGGPLRQFVSQGYHLKAYIDLVGTDAFRTDVSAYPAVTIVVKDRPGATRFAYRPSLDRIALAAIAKDIVETTLPERSSVRELNDVVKGAEPWLFDSARQIELVRRLEAKYPVLEDTGCKVGIGVATGADQAFIGDFEALDVEPDRKLPLVATRDIASGEVVWQGKGVIDPFSARGSLVDLRDYPKLAGYLERHRAAIAGRHCAQKSPESWYRTIDRIWPALRHKPKLLIPDIKGKAHVVFESGQYYPHHNLYYVTAADWDLRALQAILLSSVSRLFVATYSTKMRGGYLRFQAQYLRRIRIPHWHDVPANVAQALVEAARSRDIAACDRAAFELYGLDEGEQAIVAEAEGVAASAA